MRVPYRSGEDHNNSHGTGCTISLTSPLYQSFQFQNPKRIAALAFQFLRYFDVEVVVQVTTSKKSYIPLKSIFLSDDCRCHKRYIFPLLQRIHL